MHMKFNFAVFMGYSLEIHGIFIKMWFIMAAFNKPWKKFHLLTYMPKSVHMQVKHLTYIAFIMHVKFEVTSMTKLFHMCEKISHVIKCMEKKFTHMENIVHMYYKISYACQKVHMHVKCWCGELVFLPTWISHGFFFSHSFHTLFTWFSQI